MFGHFWAIPIPQSRTVDHKVKKPHHQVSYVWPAWSTTAWNINMAAIYESVKNRSKFHEKMVVFCRYLAMNGKFWVQMKFSTHI